MIGVSPDDAASHQRFRNKYGLRFPLLTDADHAVMDAWRAWGEKTSYGRTSVGVLRSTPPASCPSSRADRRAPEPAGHGLGQLGLRVGGGGGPAGDDPGVGADQEGTVAVDVEGCGRAVVEGVEVQGDGGVEGGGGGGPGGGVGAGEEGQAPAEEVKGGERAAVASGSQTWGRRPLRS